MKRIFRMYGIAFMVMITLCASYCPKDSECPPSHFSDYYLNAGNKQFMNYTGTETLVFIDLKNNRDTIKFKGTGMQNGMDTVEDYTSGDPCVWNTLLLEYTKVHFVNENNLEDQIVSNVALLYFEKTKQAYLTINNGAKPYSHDGFDGYSYYRDLFFTKIENYDYDSLMIDGTNYYKILKLKPERYENGTFIYWNATQGIITYRDEILGRELVLKYIIKE